MQDAFKEIEEQFLRLRGQFAVGLITAEEFDAALQELQVEDAEGRVWMIGANTGRWYYTKNPEWVEGDPVHPAAEPDEPASVRNAIFTNEGSAMSDDAASPEARGPVHEISLTEEPTDARSSRKAALVFLAIGVALLAVAALFIGVLNADNPLFASEGASLPTRIAPRIAESDAFIPPTPTPFPTRQAHVIATTVPVTATPALVIEPTSTAPVLTVIPTITPNRSPNKRAPSNSSLPPAVYVTNLRVSPNPPRRAEQVTFTASFWNTNRESVGMNWRIILLDPNRQGRNKDYGESPFAGITVPPGRTEYSITFTPVNSGGPCTMLQAIPARRQDDNSRIFLMGTSGSPFSGFFTFC